MTTIQHNVLTDPDLHEPKGISSATANQIYVADGAGSGAWEDISGFVVLPAYPVGFVMPFAGSTAPNGWQFCYGQTLNRAEYASLFSVIGTNYGAGDGSTTFLAPDCRGRVGVGRDNMGGVAADRVQEVMDGTVLGEVGGEEAALLLAIDIPALTGTTVSGGSHTHTITNGSAVLSTANAFPGSSTGRLYGVTDRNREVSSSSAITLSTTGAHTHTITINAGNNNARHNNVQPTIVMNMIIFTGVYS